VPAVAWTLAVSFNATVIERVVTVLVIARPHALGLAIPLVPDRIAMEGARNLDAIILIRRENPRLQSWEDVTSCHL